MSDRDVATDRNIFLSTLQKRWRAWLRAIHRDVGYLAVGLTLIYALSGLAINHIQDWDPNFTTYEKVSKIEPIDVALDDDAAIALAMERVGISGTPRSTYRAGDEIHIELDGRRVVIIDDQVTDQGRSPRFFLRVANWLHYNRGKRAWTYVADFYAVMLLYLAISGLFMLKGKLGMRWRGTLLVGIGAAVPLGYVVLSGGPDAKNKAQKNAAPAPVPGDEGPPDPPPERPPVRPPVRTPVSPSSD